MLWTIIIPKNNPLNKALFIYLIFCGAALVALMHSHLTGMILPENYQLSLSSNPLRPYFLGELVKHWDGILQAYPPPPVPRCRSLRNSSVASSKRVPIRSASAPKTGRLVSSIGNHLETLQRHGWVGRVGTPWRIPPGVVVSGEKLEIGWIDISIYIYTYDIFIWI